MQGKDTNVDNSAAQHTRIPIKSGGFAYIIAEQKDFIEGQACFLPAEWLYVKKLASAMHEAEEKKSFFQTLLEKKTSSTNYLVYEDFPLEMKTPSPMKEGYLVDFVGGIIEKLKNEGTLK